MKLNLPSRLLQTPLRWIVLLTLLVDIHACSKKPQADALCSYTSLPPNTEILPGQGALQVEGATDAYFYVFDKDGKQVNYQSVGKALGLNPGKYQVKLNSSTHYIDIQKGMLTQCGTGTLMVNGTTDEYYYVLDSLNQQLHYDKLGKASSFFPSWVVIKVNNSKMQVEMKLNQVSDVKTGMLIVRGRTDEYYYVFDGLGEQLNYNTLEKPLAFLPGSYSVKVNSTEMKAKVVAEQPSELQTGTLMVKGLTDEYFYVFDIVGKQLNYQKLNNALAFFPGSYQIKVNNTVAAGDVLAGEDHVYETGSFIVKGDNPTYYYVFDKTGIQLNYNALNKPLSFFPAEYTVKLDENTRAATVTKGKETEVKF